MSNDIKKCGAKTKTGAQCKRAVTAKGGYNYCTQHFNSGPGDAETDNDIVNDNKTNTNKIAKIPMKKVNDLLNVGTLKILTEENEEISIEPSQRVTGWRPIIDKNGTQRSALDENINMQPLMLDGMDYPVDEEGNPLYYYAQFYDPNPRSTFNNDLVQIFIKNPDEITGDGTTDAYIRTINLSDIGNMNITKMNKPHKSFNISGGIIVGWKMIDTVFTGDIIDCPDNNINKFFDDNDIGTECDEDLLQIKGIPLSPCQNIKYDENSTYFNGILNGQWANSGVLNISLDGAIYGESL
jgi:hypothetical protein